MTDNLSALVSRVQAQLVDDGTNFTTATVSAAIRQALRDFNRLAPVHYADLIPSVDGQKVYELSGGDFQNVLDILDVLKADSSGDDDQPLAYDAFFEDNRPWLRLRDNLASGDILVRFTAPHTIQDLDSATASTLTAEQDQTLVDGACGYACQNKAAGIAETNRLNPDAAKEYKAAAQSFFAAFRLGVRRYANRRPAKSKPRADTWLTDDIAYSNTSQRGALNDL